MRAALPHRRRLLLAVVQVFGGRVRPLDFQQYLFLHEMEFAASPSYHFVPHRRGAFSLQSRADKRALAAAGLLAESDDWLLAGRADFLGQLRPARRRGVMELKLRYGKLRGRDLVKETYRRYPYYAFRSEIAGELMHGAELAAIEDARPKDDGERLFTIGYEGVSIDAYVGRLVKENVRALCDVRRNPVSRKHGFSKAALGDAVREIGIDYVHVPELGVCSAWRRSLATRRDYARLLAQYERSTLREARDAIDQVAALCARRHRVALTCFEADARICHRSRIAKALESLPSFSPLVRHLQCAGQPLAPGVVQVNAAPLPADRVPGGLDGLPDPRRVGVAAGVRQANLVAAQGRHALGDGRHLRDGDRSGDGAAEGRRQADFPLRAAVPRAADIVPENCRSGALGKRGLDCASLAEATT